MVTMLKRALKIAPRKLQPVTQTPDTRLRGRAWLKLRAYVMRRDRGLCQLCLSRGDTTPAREVDHKTPIWRGGSDHDSNLWSLCRRCHAAKTAQEAGHRARGFV